jgi:hypothetical protein
MQRVLGSGGHGASAIGILRGLLDRPGSSWLLRVLWKAEAEHVVEANFTAGVCVVERELARGCEWTRLLQSMQSDEMLRNGEGLLQLGGCRVVFAYPESHNESSSWLDGGLRVAWREIGRLVVGQSGSTSRIPSNCRLQ